MLPDDTRFLQLWEELLNSLLQFDRGGIETMGLLAGPRLMPNSRPVTRPTNDNVFFAILEPSLR